MAKVDFKKQVERYEKSVPNLALRKAKETIHITFNFSFVTNNNSYNFYNTDLTEDHKNILLERVLEISKMNIIELTARHSKKHGLEKINKSSLGRRDKLKKMEVDLRFQRSERNKLAKESFWIFRLCPNNNPYPSRIIGKMIDDVFYVMFIDLEHELYAKRK